MKKLNCALIFLLLTACMSTPYGKYGLLGGYTDSRIDMYTFSISVDNNGFTNQQTTSMHGLYRAAELTVKHSFDYFIIVTESVNPTSMYVAMPSSSSSTLNSYSSSISTTYSASNIMPMIFPNASFTIKTYNGDKPKDNPKAYDAREMMKFIGPQIGIKSE